MTAKRPAQCKSNPVSGRSLHKTGIIPEVAGDFRRLALQNRRNGRRETKPNSRNAGISGLISHFFGSRAERRNAWLATQCRSHLSPANSLQTGNFTGKITILRPQRAISKEETAVPQGLFSKFPKQTIREKFPQNREF
jgi:hypothetical protein